MCDRGQNRAEGGKNTTEYRVSSDAGVTDGSPPITGTSLNGQLATFTNINNTYLLIATTTRDVKQIIGPHAKWQTIG